MKSALQSLKAGRLVSKRLSNTLQTAKDAASVLSLDPSQFVFGAQVETDFSLSLDLRPNLRVELHDLTKAKRQKCFEIDWTLRQAGCRSLLSLSWKRYNLNTDTNCTYIIKPLRSKHERAASVGLPSTELPKRSFWAILRRIIL